MFLSKYISDTFKSLRIISKVLSYQNKYAGIVNPASSLPKPGNLNAHELVLAAANPFEATQVYVSSEGAKVRTAKYYVYPDSDNTNANAFKHAIWNALMTSMMNAKEAEKWATAHERSSATAIAAAMDLLNNNYGRELYVSLGKVDFSVVEKQLLQDIGQKKLKRIINNQLALTDHSGRK